MQKNIETILAHYGSQEEWARQWGVTPSAVSQWVAQDDVPIRRLVDIEELSSGKLTSYIKGGFLVVEAKGA